MSNKKLVLVDDHSLLRSGLASLVESLGYDVLFQAGNGKEFISKLKEDDLPELVLLDINMPEMNGYETAAWIRQHHPSIKVLALSMYEEEAAIIGMLKQGARGYILKDAEPAELRQAIDSILTRGFHYSELVTGRLIHAMQGETAEARQTELLTEREKEFLKLAATEMTYKEIAEHMHISPRTIDSYRDNLFEKLELKSRVGLVLYAIRTGIVTVA